MPSPLLVIALSVVGLQLGAAVLPLAAAALGLRRGLKRGERRRGPGEIEFVIVTKASQSVMSVLREVIERVRMLFPEYTVWVVVDEGSWGLHLLRLWSRELGFRLVVVPTRYRKGRFKSRAIQYFVDTRVFPEKWYVFLDDDSYPLDDRFLYEIRDDIPVYNGHIYPRRGRSLLSWLLDGSRYFNSISRQRLALSMLHKPIYGLHGELLIVRGWVLKVVPMASDSIAEDTLYAARLTRKGIPVGMVSTRVSILSPHTIIDFWRQRARWQLGVLRDIVRGLYPLELLLGRGVDVLIWLLAPLSPLVWGYLAASLRGHPYGLHALAALGVALYLVVIVNHGLVAMKEMGTWRGLGLVAAMLPILVIAYYLSPIYALARVGRITREFIVIEKEDIPEIRRESPIVMELAALEALATPPMLGPASLQRGVQG